MTGEDMEFVDLRSLAIRYNSTKQDILDTAKRLIKRGYGIDVLEWGGTRKIKVNQRQFRSALLKEYRINL